MYLPANPPSKKATSLKPATSLALPKVTKVAVNAGIPVSLPLPKVTNLSPLPAKLVQPEALSPEKAPDPAHKLEYLPAADGSKGALDFKITYPDGTIAIYDGLHKPVIVNGTLVKTATYELDGRTYVPIRAVSESLGLPVEWDPAARKAVIKNGDRIVELSAGSSEALISQEAKSLGGPVAIIDGLTCVPLVFVSEAFGVNVTYAATREESIVSGVNGNIIIESRKPESLITQEEAVTRAKAELGAHFESFKKWHYNPSVSESRRDAYKRLYTRITGLIDSMAVTGEIGGYYIIQGPKAILFDKATGVMHFKGQDFNGSYVASLVGDYGRYDAFNDYFAS
jgi:hypothetical protein